MVLVAGATTASDDMSFGAVGGHTGLLMDEAVFATKHRLADDLASIWFGTP